MRWLTCCSGASPAFPLRMRCWQLLAETLLVYIAHCDVIKFCSETCSIITGLKESNRILRVDFCSVSWLLTGGAAVAAARRPSSHAPAASVARVSQNSSTCWSTKHGLLKGGQTGRWSQGFGDPQQDHFVNICVYTS